LFQIDKYSFNHFNYLFIFDYFDIFLFSYIFFILYINYLKTVDQMSYSDDDLRNAVNAVFDAYDADKSGTLEKNEITKLINDALKHMGQDRVVTEPEVQQFINAVDKNGDGKIAKP
jgi:Ca2+-binding EF-hand superfamily protein